MFLPQFPYLYACAECGAKVQVSKDGKVHRTCSHNNASINAPRKSLLTGDGTLNSVPRRVRWQWTLRCWLTRLTGRSI